MLVCAALALRIDRFGTAIAAALALAGAGLLVTGLARYRRVRRALGEHQSVEAEAGPTPMAPPQGDEDFLRAVDHDIGRRAAPGLLGIVRFCDVDRIAVFDRHDAEGLLAQFSKRLAEAARPIHLIGQIDRNSFGVWFRGEDTLTQLQAEFRGIVYVVSQEMRTGERVLTTTIEAAAASYPSDGADCAQLVLNGLAALTRADGARLEETVPTARRPARSDREDFELEQDLAQAIATHQLRMVYQPVVDLPSGRLLGAEALLRWTHPHRGEVPPSRFIPVMEAVGLSDRFGLWVLNAACKEARRWRDDGQDGLKVAVNLSARQLLDPTLRAKIARTLDRHGLPAAALELELTETAAMADVALTRRLFGELRDMGLSLAIDDFGAGYSSLSYLKNLPFDKLKIDREFVTDVHLLRDSQAICRALIELGRGLELQVLAEGVETRGELDMLQGMGCRIFQGFLIARPMSSDAFRALAAPGAGPDPKPSPLQKFEFKAA